MRGVQNNLGVQDCQFCLGPIRCPHFKFYDPITSQSSFMIPFFPNQVSHEQLDKAVNPIDIIIQQLTQLHFMLYAQQYKPCIFKK